MRVIRTAILWGIALPVFAVEMPIGIFRGSFVRWEGTGTAGTVTAQNATGTFDCHYDRISWLELEKRRVTADKLREGDPIEILADRHPGETACYVQELKVIPPEPRSARARPTASKPPLLATRPVVVRHGQDHFAGVVTKMDASTVTLHTREGEQIFHLRPDTRYIGNGLRMERSDISVNMRLSIEASTNRDGNWEAFQLTWGSITQQP